MEFSVKIDGINVRGIVFTAESCIPLGRYPGQTFLSAPLCRVRAVVRAYSTSFLRGTRQCLWFYSCPAHKSQVSFFVLAGLTSACLPSLLPSVNASYLPVAPE